jgi:hypothetical protein
MRKLEYFFVLFFFGIGGFCVEATEQKTELTLDFPLVLQEILQQESTGLLSLERKEELVFSCYSAYLDLYYAQQHYDLIQKKNRRFSSQELLQEIQKSYLDSLKDFQMLLQLPENLRSRPLFLLPDPVSLQYPEDLERMEAWELRHPLEAPEHSTLLREQIRDLIACTLALQKKEEKRQENPLKFWLDGIRLQVTLGTLQKEYKKHLAAFALKTGTLGEILKVSLIFTLWDHPLLRESSLKLNKEITKTELSELIHTLENAVFLEKVPLKEAFFLLARAFYYYGVFFHTSEQREERLEIFRKGRESAQKSLLADPRLAQRFEKNHSWVALAQEMDEENAPCFYWLCANWARLGDTRGLSALADAPLVCSIVVEVSKRVPLYDGAGCFRFLGVYYCRVPKVMGQDLERAKEFFKKAIQKAPDFLGNRLLFAQYYCPLTEDEAFYLLLVEEIFRNPLSSFPAVWTLENAWSISRGTYLLTQEARDEFF